MKLNLPDNISNESIPLYEFAEFSFDAKDKVLFKDGETAEKPVVLLKISMPAAVSFLQRQALRSYWQRLQVI